MLLFIWAITTSIRNQDWSSIASSSPNHQRTYRFKFTHFTIDSSFFKTVNFNIILKVCFLLLYNLIIRFFIGNFDSKISMKFHWHLIRSSRLVLFLQHFWYFWYLWDQSAFSWFRTVWPVFLQKMRITAKFTLKTTTTKYSNQCKRHLSPIYYSPIRESVIIKHDQSIIQSIQISDQRKSELVIIKEFIFLYVTVINN